MGVDVKTKDIGGHTYKLTTFGARKGMAVAMTLVRFLGPTLAEALGGNKEVRKAARAVQAGLTGADPVDGPQAAAAVKDASKATDEALGDLLVRGIQTFAATARPEDFDALVEAFVNQCKLVQPLITKAAGESQDIQLTLTSFDAHFAGRYRDLVTWLVWCVTVNFSDFFGE